MTHRVLLLLLCIIQNTSLAERGEKPRVRDVKVTLLSTMLTEFCGVGEWGFAALVEVDGHPVLFDTGGRPDTVLQNASELGVDLSSVNAVVLSHNHWDHTGGLVAMRRSLMKTNAYALRYAHVGKGMFLPRQIDPEAVNALPRMPPEFVVSILERRRRYEQLGGQFTIHEKAHELLPGVWITGPIPRIHPERNWTPFMRVQVEGKMIEDTIPEDQSLIIDTVKGLVVVLGCGHAGVVNTLDFARKITKGRPIYAVLGGFHLMSATDEHLKWTGTQMRAHGVEHILGAHCTGINAVGLLREAGGYDRKTAVVGAVGSTFTLEEGIQIGLLNR